MNASSLDQKVDEAANLSLNDNEQDIVNAIERLKEFLISPNLGVAQQQNIQLQLAQAYQRRGEHSAALETLKLIKLDARHQNSQMVFSIKFCAAISYCALGLYQESCDIFDGVLRELVLLDINPSIKGSIFLEAGKAFFQQSK